MIETEHRTLWEDARTLAGVGAGSVDLVVTSPPYPMITLWDEGFTRMNGRIGEALGKEDGTRAFSLMHGELDEVWRRCGEALREGGVICVNIGDATRTIGDRFRLYPNHERVLRAFMEMGGFDLLPIVHWRKTTNSPTKFMGSGMLPPGAYVTLEHEYILILRKGGRRRFDSSREKDRRRRSGFFWEERNLWFSDLWNIPGRDQDVRGRDGRRRSGAFPFEVAYRLVCMFSVIGDHVLDPFVGTGTSQLAAMAACRNSTGIEWDRTMAPFLEEGVRRVVEDANRVIDGRLAAHRRFCERWSGESSTPLSHTSRAYGFPVMTGQETDILLPRPVEVRDGGAHRYKILYRESASGEKGDGGEGGEAGGEDSS